MYVILENDLLVLRMLSQFLVLINDCLNFKSFSGIYSLLNRNNHVSTRPTKEARKGQEGVGVDQVSEVCPL